MMNKILSFIVLSFLLVFTSCKKDDATDVPQARPYAEVYPEDLLKIEDYLETHYVTVTRNSNNDVTNVVLGKIEDGTPQNPIADNPLLTFKTVKLHNLEYKVYYLKLNEGLAVDNVNYDNGGKHPCGVDNVITSYEGYLLDGTKFDFVVNNKTFNLFNVVKGWQHVFPEFRSGANVIGGSGGLATQNYGSGVMFLPSGLGYYNATRTNIPAYSPLIFNFNLYGVVHTDLDDDKIESRFEYGYDDKGDYIDTDGDGIPDFADKDDDNDAYETIDEIKYTVGSETFYYKFDEIPVCTDGKKRHLTKVCHD